jgi:HK97 family phage prohead protease
VSTLDYKSFSLEIKSLDEAGKFSGIASTYSTEPDYMSDVIKPGAFTKTIKDRGPEIPILWSHHMDEPVGKGLLTDTASALLIDGDLALDLPEGQKAYTRMLKKIARGLSIGYDERRLKSYMKDGIRYLTEIPLLEVSLCTIPVNPGTWVTQVKALLEQKATFSEVLERMELMSGSYQMLDALRESLWTITGDSGTDDDKIVQADQSIEDFRRQYLEYLPRYLAVTKAYGKAFGSADDLIEGKAGARHSSVTRTRMQESILRHEGGIREHKEGIKILKALLDAEAASAGTSAKGAAADPEPDSLHSLDLSGLFQNWKGYLPTSKTKN